LEEGLRCQASPDKTASNAGLELGLGGGELAWSCGNLTKNDKDDIVKVEGKLKMSTKYEFPVIIEKDEDGILIASVPSLPGCHTQATNITTLLKRIKEAILLYLDVRKDIPHLKFVGLQEVEVTK
jgi:predicted RNase H-like HicB family nuclease